MAGTLGKNQKFDDIIDQVAGVNPRVMLAGEVDGVWSCGMAAGLIHDVPTCMELIERMVAGTKPSHLTCCRIWRRCG